MTIYLYKNHLGGFYAKPYLLSWQECHCTECGENDYLLGTAETKEEARKVLEEFGLDRVWYAEKIIMKCSSQ